MNFKSELKSIKTVDNNSEIVKLQSKFEALAWNNQEIAIKMKQAVGWLRVNPTANAEQAMKEFGLN